MIVTEGIRWWTIRRAQNRKPAHYLCPFCEKRLAAVTEHMLVMPEGDSSRRRHAHTECVLQARRSGQLPMIDDWKATQPKPPSLLERLRAWLTR